MSTGLRTIFFGTPDFAVPTLAALVDAGWAPRAVVSQPARPSGRGRKLKDPPVAEWARDRDLPVWQPETIRGRGFRRRVEALRPDVAVVVAYGQIFRRRLLAVPPLGCINLHASLLPRYRGAAPIQAAIAAGERRTGVTSMVMDVGLDSGPTLLAEEVEIGPLETTAELMPRLAETGAPLMVRTLRALAAGEIAPRPQDEELATIAPLLAKSDGIVDWRLPAEKIFDRLRAYTPWPGTVSQLRGRPLKVLWARVVDGGRHGSEAASAAPGSILGHDDGRVLVACGSGSILGLERVQLAGKKPISALDLFHGGRVEVGERLGAQTEV